MDAKVENKNGVYVINLSGQMNFESADQLKSQCLKSFSSHDIIFNLKDLNFVGSSGITPFLELISELSKSLGTRFKICSVGVDFMRLFQSTESDGIEIYKDVSDARQAFVSGAESLAITRLKPFGLNVNIE